MHRQKMRTLAGVICLLLLQIVRSLPAFSQQSELGDLQKQVKNSISKAYKASVRIWGYDSVTKAQNSAQFSGVVVGADGTILTVAHAIRPGKLYKVRFPDGTETLANALGRIGLGQLQDRPDVGMLRIRVKGNWPYAELGWSHSLKVNTPCISISYPETLNQLLPSIRFGRIGKVLDEFGFIKSTCKMEPGDSGGPLFDIMGRIIGIHSRCELPEDENYEVPIDVFRKFWTALQLTKDYSSVPPDTNVVGEDSLAAKISSYPFLENLGEGLTKIAPDRSKAVAQLKSKLKGKQQKVLGTILSYGGKFYLVSKSSMVGDDVCIYLSGVELKVTVVARDAENDLVLIGLNRTGNTKLEPFPLEDTSAFTLTDLGTFVCSPLANGQRNGILSTLNFSFPKKQQTGFNGLAANFYEGKISVVRLMEDGPAAMAGVKEGDEIQQINDIDVKSASQYNQVMVKYRVGDTVVLKGLRNGQPFSVKMTLIEMPLSNHPAYLFDGGKSKRCDGFPLVFTHDSIIRPEECGGPVFDIKGRFLGINIARFNRTSTIALPGIAILKFIRNNSATEKI